MKRQQSSALAIAFGAMALTGTMRNAHAITTNYTTFLLDATGSMAELGPDAVNTRWDYAIKKARQTFKNELGTVTDRGIAIFTFKLDLANLSAPVVQQAWPTDDADCTDLGLPPASDPDYGFKTVSAGSLSVNYCVFDSGTPTDGIWNNDLPTTILENTIRPLGPTYDGPPNTPLAKSLCQIIELSQLGGGNGNRTIVLESDGYENMTEQAYACWGDTATVTNPAEIIPTSALGDWGYPAIASPTVPGNTVSWQARVVRRGVNANNPDTTAAVASKVYTAMSRLTWNVTAMFDFYPAGGLSSVSTKTATASASPSVLSVMLAAAGATDGANQVFPASPLNAVSLNGTRSYISSVSSATAAATAAASTGSYSMSAAELGLFRSLGMNNSKSKYSELIFNVDQPEKYGSTHKVPGDVDNSGCTDRADYAIIHQSDVWMQRAPWPPNTTWPSIQVLADLNADGWDDGLDAKIVIQNWGAGTKKVWDPIRRVYKYVCPYPVGTPPKS
jgi:hypothetical protein